MRKLSMNELQRPEVQDVKNAQKTPIILILDDIRSMQNVGSVFRTSDAFLIEKIYLCGITATPPHKDINKSALGATETVAWEYAKDVHEIIKNLKDKAVMVYAVEQVDQSVYLNQFYPPENQKIALVFGNEVNGVQQSVIDMCKACIEIPQLGHKHSLNIAVSCGMVVWDVFCKLKHPTTHNTMS